MLDAQPRRTILVGAGVGAAATALAACSTYGKQPDADGDAPPSSSDTGAASAAPEAPVALAKTADVPVGSAVILDDVVLTQPTAGDFKGFSSVCPHAGCNVSEVVDAVIVCPCHGSEFSLDGAVVKGPAKKPLETTAITVSGDSIIAG